MVRTLVPWLIAATAMTLVFRAVIGLPPQPDKVHALAAAFRGVPYAQFLAITTLLLIVNCAADSLAMFYTFRWFGCRLPYRELFIVRASTYLLAVIQYYVGQAAIVHFLHTRRGVPLARAAGWILFISGINMGVLVLLAAVGLVGSAPAVPWLRQVPIGVAVGAALYAAVLLRKPRLVSDARVLAPLFEAGIVGHARAVAVRLPHILVLVVWHFVSLRMFHVEVPFFTAMVLLPAVFFAAALPISVQGLGLSQAAAVYFFSSYAPAGKAAVLAYSLALTTASLIFQIVFGLIFLAPARRLGLDTHAGDHLDEPAVPAPPEDLAGPTTPKLAVAPRVAELGKLDG